MQMDEQRPESFSKEHLDQACGGAQLLLLSAGMQATVFLLLLLLATAAPGNIRWHQLLLAINPGASVAAMAWIVLSILLQSAGALSFPRAPMGKFPHRALTLAVLLDALAVLFSLMAIEYLQRSVLIALTFCLAASRLLMIYFIQHLGKAMANRSLEKKGEWLLIIGCAVYLISACFLTTDYLGDARSAKPIYWTLENLTGVGTAAFLFSYYLLIRSAEKALLTRQWQEQNSESNSEQPS